MTPKIDCRYFRGDIPCKFHKTEGVFCDNCEHYDKITHRILIIKLGAIGDVIRTTPLLHKFKKEYPYSEIYWLTYSPAVVPDSVDHILNIELKNILYLQAIHFDLLINLDKDREACALADQIEADSKFGFKLEGGRCVPIDDKAMHKWLTGISDDLNRANTKSYLEEIFEICGYKFSGERYILNLNDNYEWDINEPRPLIGLNTGCGSRWTTRLWSTENWIKLAKDLKSEGYGVILLGGEEENERNRYISKEAGVIYLGYFPLNKFFSLVNQCNLIITAVSMALHIATGLGKKIVLFNNIFNRNEFELYGLGKIIEPDVECKGCFRGKCDTDCMSLINPEEVLSACKYLLGSK